MNGSSKILTVSYGTFSCTLEGFDDPLGTMRELAEYFRDLAADDRYFGAEPPTPDVEMLQNIAQRDVNRRVEARTSATGVALTQVEQGVGKVTEPTDPTPAVEDVQVSPEPAKPQAAAAADAEAKTDSGPLTFDDDFLMADEPEDVLAVDPDAALIAEGPAETVAEKLRRIRAVVSRRPNEQERAAQAPESESATSETKRDRAMSETIRQIQSDLADDEAAKDFEDDPQENQALEVKPEDTPLPEAEQAHEAAAPSAPNASPEDDKATPETHEQGADVDTEDRAETGRTVSQFLENVSEKISDAAAEPTPNEPKPLTDSNTDADVGRLLEETDNKLNEDGVVHRRQVISQMRAAVAATKADRAVTRLISPEAQDEVEKSAYRNDLSDAVGTTKPLPQQKSARKPSGPPLVLVSSQRVSNADSAEAYNDGDLAENSQPTPSTDSSGFAEFLELNDAKGLDEMLEAAAAYTIFAKGQESFSRPEIMKRVAMIDPAQPLSREDGLRSFGQLLRQGKFQKLDRGQFTIDHDTRFNPDKRIAGE